jgi:hypothetical protein
MSSSGNGSSKGKVDDKFAKRISELEDKAGQQSASFRFGNARDWHVPEELKEKELLDVPGLDNPAWDRNEINRIYAADVLGAPGENGGTTGDLIAMKWQADFMAQEERAFRMRHASYTRCAAFMHGRLDGHGVPKRGIFGFLKDGVQSFISAGRS